MNIVSFAPIAQTDSQMLILGTMPGIASLHMHQYYAHPRNAFWNIIFGIFGEPFSSDYTARIDVLLQHHIALWDVLHTCKRKGSADSTIEEELPNPIDQFLLTHKHIQTILFNGTSAAHYFHKHFSALNHYPTITLPSTSPANARLSFDKKMEQWKILGSL